MIDDYSEQDQREAREADEERKRFLGLPGEACGYCGLALTGHINERYCPEWALRASDGDR